jgi:hypothetical protein
VSIDYANVRSNLAREQGKTVLADAFLGVVFQQRAHPRMFVYFANAFISAHRQKAWFGRGKTREENSLAMQSSTYVAKS